MISGAVLVVVGARVILPITDESRVSGHRPPHEPADPRRRGRRRRARSPGLLANGGGFLLMPLYLLVFGLRMRQAVGTSLLVIAVLSVPTLITHAALGHVDWWVAAQVRGRRAADERARRRTTPTGSAPACSAASSACSSSSSALAFTIYRLTLH